MKKKNTTNQDIELPLLEKLPQSPCSNSNNEKQQNGYSRLKDIIYLGDPRRKFKPIKSLFKFLTFADMIPLTRKINEEMTQKITTDEIPKPYKRFDIPRRIVELDAHWQQEVLENPDQPSLLKALYRTFKKQIWIAGLITYAVCLCHILDSFYVGKMINIVSSINTEEDPDNDFFMMTFMFAIIFLTKVWLETYYFYLHLEITFSIVHALRGLLFKKINCISLSSLQELNVGKVINLLANDINDIQKGGIFLWSMTASPFSICVVSYFMWEHFGWFTIVAMSVLIAFMNISNFISNLSRNVRSQKNLATDNRIKMSNQVIEAIRLIKLYAWEQPMMKIIEKIRQNEMNLIEKLNSFQNWNLTMVEMSIYASMFLISICFVLTGSVLTPEKVYTSISYLNFTRRRVLMHWSQGRNFIVNAQLMKNRLEEVLMIPEIVQLDQQNIRSKSQHTEKGSTNESIYYRKLSVQNGQSTKMPPSSVRLVNFYGYWSKNQHVPFLKNININFPERSLTTIIGRIGSGKSTLLLSLLNEIPKYTGTAHIEGRVAYVEQEPIIFSRSVKQNILFGKPFHPEFYAQVLKASCLDLDLKEMEFGDQTVVGERGVTLSGGQKARMSLARALYSRSDVYLLDDPLSAVDAKVARTIYEEAIRGLLSTKTVILVTHHLSYAKEADKVIVMSNGEVEAQGSFAELEKKNIDILSVFKEDDNTKANQGSKSKTKEKDQESEEIDDDDDDDLNIEPIPKLMNNSKSTPAIKVMPSQTQSLKRKTSEKLSNKSGFLALDMKQQKVGTGGELEDTVVTYQTYLQYFGSDGRYKKGLLFLGSNIAAQLLIVAFTRYIGLWAELQFVEKVKSRKEGRPFEFDHTEYILVLGSILLALLVSAYLRGYFLINYILTINTSIHKALINRALRATVAFFDETPIGSILNRFSTNIGYLDKEFWTNIFYFVNGFIQIACFMGYLCIINTQIAIPCIIVVYFFVRIRNYFEKPQTQTKQLELVTTSPLYSEISSSIHGLVIIRVYQQGINFVKNFMDLSYESSRVSIANQRIQRFMSMILYHILYILVVGGVLIFVFRALYLGIDSSLFGLSLYYLLTVGGQGIFVTRQSIFVTLGMQHAERIFQLDEIPQEPPQSAEKDGQLGGIWPKEGSIEFKNVFMKYESTNTFALNGVNMKITPGSKVGIVGRTGAGKSSLLQVIFRMTEIEEMEDSYLAIDGVDIREVGIEFLRKNLAIIPQTPVIFSGTIRENLDPFQESSDEKLMSILEEIGLNQHVQNLPEGLNTKISGSSSIFSAGQKQLVCLARIIIRKSQIVILDEATANVDIETDALVQNKIMEVFKECTIITIAHRLITIAGYDKIVVMDKGMVAEYDHPYILLVKNVGEKEITNTNGLFAQMVLKSGQNLAAKIFDKAYENFHKQM